MDSPCNIQPVRGRVGKGHFESNLSAYQAFVLPTVLEQTEGNDNLFYLLAIYISFCNFRDFGQSVILPLSPASSTLFSSLVPSPQHKNVFRSLIALFVQGCFLYESPPLLALPHFSHCGQAVVPIKLCRAKATSHLLLANFNMKLSSFIFFSFLQ